MTALVIGLAVMTVVGLTLFLARQYWPASEDALVREINACLPQTQCAQCGFPGCLPYARALAEGSVPLDLCPPGGTTTHSALVRLLPGHSAGRPPSEPEPVLAHIDAGRCIGCYLCIPACPVDAIVGARGYLHAVLTKDCTGCGLCLPPCPVDCITLEPAHRS